MRKIMLIHLLLAAIAASILAECSSPRPSESQIERAIERELHRVIGPAEDYEVNVEGVENMSYARRVTAVGRRVQPEDSPALDRIEIDLQDVEYDSRREQVVSIGNAEASVRVLDRDIAEFLDENRNLQDVSVSLEAPNRTRVEARPDIPGLPVPLQREVSIRGVLVSANAMIDYDITEVRANGTVLPGAVERTLSEEINPLVDLSRMPIDWEVLSVRVENRAIVARLEGTYSAR